MIKSSPLIRAEAPILPSEQDASGRTLGDEEITLLTGAIRSGTLTSTKGAFVKALERRFAEILGVRCVLACSSGTAAIHATIAAFDPSPGDEIIVSPINDIGVLTPILYQGAIPVFADVDRETCNITAKTIEPCLSSRTRAIIATHMFGNPCDMTGIVELAKLHSLPVIEDCAQAYLSRHNGRIAGTIGNVGCFSLQQSNHITTGEGGLIATDDEDLSRRLSRFINKGQCYGDADSDYNFLSLNYRMSELQGAVGVAQLRKIDAIVQSRIAAANTLTRRLKDIRGIEHPSVVCKNLHTYHKYCLKVDRQIVSGGNSGLGRLLEKKGIYSAPESMTKPAFHHGIFQNQKTFGNSRFPFTFARPEAVDYKPSKFEGTFEALNSLLVLPWNEHYDNEHIDYIASSIRDAVEQLK